MITISAVGVTAGVFLPSATSADRAGKAPTTAGDVTTSPSSTPTMSSTKRPAVKPSRTATSKEPSSRAKPKPSVTSHKAKGGIFTGVATHFDKTGDAGGGCGVPPAQIESKDFVALNVYDVPNNFSPSLPRPAPEALKGAWNNGLNCGRWVEIKLSDFCTTANGGAAGQGICRGGAWKRDKFNGATVKAIVTDSCADPNEWCRSDRNHLDIARGSLGRFTLNGSPVGDLETMGKWNNRRIEWSFIPAPDYRGDIKIGLAKDASKWYSPVVITNLPNGIRGVEYLENGTWKKAQMTGDNGQRYEIQPTSAARATFTVRITDAHGKPLNNGREYSFKQPSCAGESTRCDGLYTPVSYTTN
ncbi:hypothetical protein [Streptomyces scopuliridis]|uniref:hypothetical protein n=1 Tax=Streptomyces scopuliridis TaxID=452529 RepID=UPI0035E09B32